MRGQQLLRRCASSIVKGAGPQVEQGLRLGGCQAYATSSHGEPYTYVPPGRHHLFVPGPVNIHPVVQQAMDIPSANHRDPWFPILFSKLLQDVKMIFGTKEATSFIYPGTGTGGWESAIQNTLSPGDKVVAFRYGQFSHLWIDMLQRLGLEVHVIEERWGDGAHEDKLEKVLKEDTDKKIKAVCVVHNETTTGITSDVAKVRQAMDGVSHPALLLIDGVSSIGALDFQFDKWKVDVAMTGSQKALSLPTGLAVLAVSQKALDARKSAKMARCYFDWDDMIKNNKDGQVPYTPIIPLLYGLRASLDLLAAEGFDNVVKRHNRLATAARKAVEGWGLELLCKDKRWYSDSLTVVEVPQAAADPRKHRLLQGVDSGKVVKAAYSKYNLSLGVGLSQVSGKVFRIGHLGNMDALMLLSALCGAEMAMQDAGIKIDAGSGVSKAIDYLHSTSAVIPTRAAV